MKNVHLDIKAKFGVVIAVVLAAVGVCAWSGLHAIGTLDGHAKTLFGRDFDGMKTINELNVQLGHVQDEAVQAVDQAQFDEDLVDGDERGLGGYDEREQQELAETPVEPGGADRQGVGDHT